MKTKVFKDLLDRYRNQPALDGGPNKYVNTVTDVLWKFSAEEMSLADIEEYTDVDSTATATQIVLAYAMGLAAQENEYDRGYTEGLEDAEDYFSPAESPCGDSKTPKGWWCSRQKGHYGPCAAKYDLRPSSDAREANETATERNCEACGGEFFARCGDCGADW
jgi:hypothetical protein